MILNTTYRESIRRRLIFRDKGQEKSEKYDRKFVLLIFDKFIHDYSFLRWIHQRYIIKQRSRNCIWCSIFPLYVCIFDRFDLQFNNDRKILFIVLFFNGPIDHSVSNIWEQPNEFVQIQFKDGELDIFDCFSLIHQIIEDHAVVQFYLNSSQSRKNKKTKKNS